MGIGGVSITADGLEVVDFSIPHLFSRLTFVTLAPQRRQPTGVLLMPFDGKTWIYLILTFFIASFFGKLFQRIIGTKLNLVWQTFSGFLNKGLKEQQEKNFLSLASSKQRAEAKFVYSSV